MAPRKPSLVIARLSSSAARSGARIAREVPMYRDVIDKAGLKIN
jgi:hypothetical protein